MSSVQLDEWKESLNDGEELSMIFGDADGFDFWLGEWSVLVTVEV